MSCIYIFKREPLKGKVCSQTISSKSTTGKYCKQHKIIETKQVKEKKKRIDDLIKETAKEVINDDIIETEKGYLIINNTDYVINGRKSKVVIGRLINNKFSKLEDEDVKDCKIKKWRYEKFI
jgi:hypothetical protein